MKKSLMCCVGLMIVLAVATDMQAGGKNDQKALQGTWIAEGKTPVKSMTFKGNKVVVEFNKGDETGAFQCTAKLHSNTDPKGIDLKVVKGPKKEFTGKTSLGIYKIADGKLTWCAAEPGAKHRPAQFSETIGDKKFLLVTFSRKMKN